MEKKKEVKPTAYAWHEKIQKEMWALYAFATELKDDHITNNIAKSFNHSAGDIRGKPVYTLLDFLQAMLMSRLRKRYKKACMLQTEVVPNVVAKLNHIRENSRKMHYVVGW